MDAGGQVARLDELTRAFYERTHASFSATRQSAWPGWDRLWAIVGTELNERASAVGKLRLADIACGNLRFVRFLQQKTKAPLEVDAFDGCEPLLAEGLRALSAEDSRALTIYDALCDIARALAEGRDFMEDAGAHDMTVAFGFMHHLPLREQRERLLLSMAEHTAEDGFLVVSFWQFADDERLLAKAHATTSHARERGEIGELCPNDYLLGWQDDGEAFRFCHHFTEDEIDALSASVAAAATEIARFSADGKSDVLNRYVVWRRHG